VRLVSTHQTVLFVSGIVGFAPAIAVMFHALRTYDYPHTEHAYFDTSRVFLAFGVGIVLGTVSGAFTVALGVLSLLSLVIALLLIALFEEGLKLVYLNRKGYRGRFDTTFYGVPLGVGAASTAVVANVVWAEASPVPPASLALFALFSAGLSLANASSGAFVGFGASRGEMLRPLLRAVAVRYAHAGFLFPFYLRADPWGIVSVFTALGFALIVFRYVYEEILPGTLPEDLRRQLRRARRRAQAVKD